MKRRLLILATLSMMAASAFGQGPRGPRDGGGGQLNFLTGYLSLTDAQKQQAQTIFDAARTASETARGQLTTAREALTQAIRTNQSDAQLDQLAAAVGTIQGRIEAIQAKASAKFYALLTAEQKTKYDQRFEHSGPGGRPRP